jgi:hypothetical protein
VRARGSHAALLAGTIAMMERHNVIGAARFLRLTSEEIAGPAA